MTSDKPTVPFDVLDELLMNLKTQRAQTAQEDTHAVLDTLPGTAHSQHDLSYPVHPDANGIAQVSYRGKTRFFKQHNTPESWILFGRWRAHLIETGEALAVDEVEQRLDAEETPVLTTSEAQTMVRQAEEKPARGAWHRTQDAQH